MNWWVRSIKKFVRFWVISKTLGNKDLLKSQESSGIIGSYENYLISFGGS